MENSQKIMIPNTYSNGNLITHENIISNSENSFSSTHNSSSRTKLLSENTIRNHPLLNKNNINNNSTSMFKKYNPNLSRNNLYQNNTISANLTTDHFFLRKKSPNIQDIKKSGNHLIKLNTYIPKENPDFENNYFSSRNINSGPVKVMSMNEDTFKTVFSTSSLMSNSSLNQNSISMSNKGSIDFFNKIKTQRDNNINVYTSPDRKLKTRTKTLDLSPSKYSKYNLKKRSNDFSNLKTQIDYLPIFKRRKIKKKKTFIHKFSKQLSKIPENINSNISDSNKKKVFRSISSLTEKKSNLNIQILGNNNQIKEKRNSVSIIIKDNLIQEKEKKKEEILNNHSGNDSEEESSLSDDFGEKVKKNNSGNTSFFLKTLLSSKIELKHRTIKESKTLLSFENDLEDKINELNDKRNIQNNLIKTLIYKFSKFLIQKEEDLYYKTVKQFSKETYQTTLKKIENKFFISRKNIENYFIYKENKKLEKEKLKLIYRYISKEFPGEYLYDKYFDVNIMKEIEERYLEHDFFQLKENKKTIINNFQIKTCSLKRSYNLKLKENKFLSKLIPFLKRLPAKDFYYILNFHQIDYEYFIIPEPNSVKIGDVKLRLPFEHLGPKNKINNRRRSIQNNFKNYVSKDDKSKNIENILKKALKQNNYFIRFSKINRKKNRISTFTLKNSFTIHEKLIQKNFQSSINKINMITKANHLKYKLLQSLKSHVDEIIFYIKDRNYPGFVQTFEKYKVSPDTKNYEGESLLSLAVQSNSFQIVNYLLNVGATPNTKNKFYNTPLHYALSFHNFEIADMLIQRGADEKAINKMGITPWQSLDTGNSII